MGRGRYVDDIDLPDLAYGFVLRSIHANAKIRSINTKEAKALPGVIGILTGDDYASDGLGIIHAEINPNLLKGEAIQYPHAALVREYVKCVGAPVAFVVAETQSIAKDAAEIIEIDYEILESATDLSKVRSGNTPIVWEGMKSNVSFTYGMGDAEKVAAAFSDSAHIVKSTVDNNRITTNAMEPR